MRGKLSGVGGGIRGGPGRAWWAVINYGGSFTVTGGRGGGVRYKKGKGRSTISRGDWPEIRGASPSQRRSGASGL